MAMRRLLVRSMTLRSMMAPPEEKRSLTIQFIDTMASTWAFASSYRLLPSSSSSVFSATVRLPSSSSSLFSSRVVRPSSACLRPSSSRAAVSASCP